MGLQAFFFGTNLLCPAELHPCQGLSPCPVSSKPSGHQEKPASTWSSKGQHVLMESFLSFEPACSYSRIKQNFTHDLKLSLLGFTVLLVQSHVIHFLFYAKARFSPDTCTLVGPLGLFCNRESTTIPPAPTHEG